MRIRPPALQVFNLVDLTLIMAKVVLVWNEHPTEVVAGFHCRKVAEILKKSTGTK